MSIQPNILKIRNKKNGKSDQGGLVKMVIVIIIAILIISYFGFNIQKIAESDTSKSNFSYVWSLVVWVWEYILKGPVMWVWNNIVVAILWNDILRQALANLGHK
jgi:hypothetical protein